MSASREKAARRELRAEQEPKKQKQEKRVSYIKRQRRQRTLSSIISIVLVAVLVLLVFSSALFYRYNTAVVIGDDKYSVVDFNYYYSNAYNTAYSNIYNTYGSDYISYFIDTSTKLDKQEYYADSSMTWADYLTEQALESMKQVTVLYGQAMKAGYTLNDEQQAELDSYLDSVASAAESYGYSTEKYLKAVCGKGMTEEIYTEQLTRSYIASEYSDAVLDGFEYDESDLETYYSANMDDFDTVSFRYFFIDGSADDEAGIDSDTAMADALTKAETMVGVASGDVFNDLAYEYSDEESKEDYEDEDATLVKNRSKSDVSYYDFGDWLFEAHEYGDTQYFESDSGYYVVFFESRDDIRYNLVNVRHILIQPETDAETGEATSETWETAYTEAQSILDEWLAGDATEESFGELANTYSDDNDGEVTDGGLYEDVYKGQMVSEFEDWCFDESRQTGDTDIIRTSYGYHVMYFVGQGENYWETSIDTALRSSDYTSWYDTCAESYEVKERSFGMFFAGDIQ